VLLTFAERPGGFAGHGAALAGDAAVDVEHKRKLPFGKSRFMRIGHVAAELPVENLRHSFFSESIKQMID
jgi:hypothetical protein